MILEKLSTLSHWQIDLVAFWLLLQGAVISLAPEEIVIITLGILWGHEKISFIEAIVSIFTGLLPANGMMVLLGQRLSRRYAEKQSVKVASEYLRRYGAWVIFLTRFTPVVRAPVYFSVGASRFGIKRFAQIDGLAACIQVPLLLMIGKRMSEQADSIQEALKMIGWAAGGLLVLTFAVTIAMETAKRGYKTAGD